MISNRFISSPLMIQTVFFTSLLYLVSIFKVSFIVGSTAAFFSVINCVAPVIGIWSGSWISILLYMFKGIIFYGYRPELFYAYIPTLCSYYYWATQNKILQLAIPVLCMILFCLHPVGQEAWIYSLYWFIPIMLVFARKSLITIALTSTFIQHAVGSVFFLYTKPTIAPYWINLMPAVLIERLLFTSGMVITYYLLQGIVNFSKSLYLSRIVLSR